MSGKKDWFLYHTDLDSATNVSQYGLLADLSNIKLVNPSTNIVPAALSHDPLPKYIVPRHVVLESTVSKFRRICYILKLSDFSDFTITGNGVTFAYPSTGDEGDASTEVYFVVGRNPEKQKRRVTVVKHSIVTPETDPTATPA